MEDKTYLVVTDEYYFSMQTFQTIEKINLINVSYDEDSALGVKEMYEQVLEGNKDVLNANNEMLTAYSVGVQEMDGHLTIDEARKFVDENKDFSWGKVGKTM